MKKYIVTITITLLAISFYLFIEPLPGDIVKTFEITTEGLKEFKIGDTKESILETLNEQSFSPTPKPPECPRNWIDVATMTNVQKQCLLGTNIWEVGGNTEQPCPGRTDSFINLHFQNDKITKIIIKCTKPK